MKKPDPGKLAEKEVRDWLEAKSRTTTSLAVHRLPDARAARGSLSSQPSDLIVGHLGVFHFIEVKETKLETRLPREKVSQWGTLKKWHWAGINSYVIVHRSTNRDWLALSVLDLFNHEDTPGSFPFAGIPTYPTAAALLERLFP